MAIPVKLSVFEGPLDLLLHLIEKNKIDIYDIPIVSITDQYMEYIQAMKKEDLGVMSEFMVMAATLLDIKCRMLLPKEQNEEGEEEDPRAELIQRLLEYKMYKFMSYELRDRLDGAADVYYKHATIPEEVLTYRAPVDTGELLKNMTLEQLNHVFKSIIRKQENKMDPIRSKFGIIEKEEVSLSEKIQELKAYAALHKSFSFLALMEKQNSKMQLIVMFLAVLELIRMGYLKVRQKVLLEDTLIEVATDPQDWMEQVKFSEE